MHKQRMTDMKAIRAAVGILTLAGLAACGSHPVSRNAPYEVVPPSGGIVAAALPAGGASQAQAFAPGSLRLAAFEFTAPEELRTSEANLYYPIADIVWRGDPYGDRKKQISRIFETSAIMARPSLTGDRPVHALVTLTRFHSLTEKTRFTVGGVHSIGFTLTLLDAKTGQPIVEGKKIKADLRGFGGRRAIKADSQGQTMKVRIQDHLARVLRAELSNPRGWGDYDRKLERAVGQI